MRTRTIRSSARLSRKRTGGGATRTSSASTYPAPARAVTPNEEVTNAAVPAALSPDGQLAAAILARGALEIVLLHLPRRPPLTGDQGRAGHSGTLCPVTGSHLHSSSAKSRPDHLTNHWQTTEGASGAPRPRNSTVTTEDADMGGSPLGSRCRSGASLRVNTVGKADQRAVCHRTLRSTTSSPGHVASCLRAKAQER